MAGNGVVTAGGRLTDWVSLGVLAAFVPRDAVDDAVAAAGRQARRSDGKLPPHVMVYFVMALALFDDDYEAVAARLTETLTAWGCWDDSWSVSTSGGITQARQRLGYEPVKKLFAGVAAPVAEELTAGAFLGPWRLMAIDGFEWDAPDTPENAAAFGFAGTAADDPGRPAYPKVRVVTVSECAWHAVADAAIGAVAGKRAGERSLARELCRRLADDWLLIADRNFVNWADWWTAADTGAQLLWRVKADLTLPALALLPDGSYSSVLVNPKIRGKARKALLEAARGGQDLDEDQARYVRVAGYEVPDRDGDGKGEVIALVTTITAMTAAAAPLLAEAYHRRWEHETGNAQLKTSLRGPGKVLRSKSPDMVRQGIYGYLLTHYALSALTAGPPPKRASTRTGSNSSGPSASSAAGPPTRRPSPLSTRNASSPRSWPTSPATSTSTPDAGTGPARGSSNEPAPTPAASNGPATTAPATAARPRSSRTACTCPHSQHDQPVLGGRCATSCSIAGRKKVSVSSARRAIHRREAGPGSPYRRCLTSSTTSAGAPSSVSTHRASALVISLPSRNVTIALAQVSRPRSTQMSRSHRSGWSRDGSQKLSRSWTTNSASCSPVTGGSRAAGASPYKTSPKSFSSRLVTGVTRRRMNSSCAHVRCKRAGSSSSPAAQ
jgi:hypothetical protein